MNRQAVKISRSLSGSIAEKFAEIYLITRGYEVHRPATQSSKADLIAVNPEGWEPTWTLSHFNMPFIVLRDKNKHYYYVPGIPGLWFSDKPAPLEVSDTRRNSDWDKLNDKRVVRRMYRQMAKNFAGATDLHSARNHKR